MLEFYVDRIKEYISTNEHHQERKGKIQRTVSKNTVKINKLIKKYTN